MMDLQNRLKASLKRKCQNVNGERSKDITFPSRLCIHNLDILGLQFPNMDQHEFRFVDKSRLHLDGSHCIAPPQTLSTSSAVFSCDCKHDSRKRTVITFGVSGIGKTTAVRKCCLDWADGREYQAVHLLFHLTFWELNLMMTVEEVSLIGLLKTFYPELKGLDISNLDGCQVWFVLDGLDECDLPLDFSGPKISNVAEVSTVDGLLTNLFMGNLLPSAHIWVTTRPEAVNRIPLDYQVKVTELLGFSDEQKEHFFRTAIGNEDLANRAIDHVKISRSLDYLCQIPAVCSIMAVGLKKHVLKADDGFSISPINLTEIYTNMMKTQATNSNETMITMMKNLAMSHSVQCNIFYEEDLRTTGLSPDEASKYSKQFPLLLREERGLYNIPVYRFSHSSILEYFLATSILDSVEKTLSQDQIALFNYCQVMVDRALESESGHLDVVLRFMFGLLKERRMMQPTNELIYYTKSKILENIHNDRGVSMLHCLREFDIRALRDHSQILSQRMDCFDGVRAVFKMDVANSSNNEKLLRQLPDILKSNAAMLRFCNLTEKCCPALASVLTAKDSNLRELDLGYNSIEDGGVEKLRDGLLDKTCRLRILRLQGCGVTAHGCASLSSLLSQCPKLRELDLSGNKVGDDGLKQLAGAISSPCCRLDILKLSQCAIEKSGCRTLALALQQNPHQLKVLDLSINAFGDQGSIELFTKIDVSKLTKLEMYHCNLTALSCEYIFTALQSESSSLVELNLRNNDLKDPGVEILGRAMFSWCRLEKLNLARCGITSKGTPFLAEVLSSISTLYREGLGECKGWQAVELRELDLSMNSIKDKGVQDIAPGLKNPFGHLEILNLSHCDLTEKCCAVLGSVLGSNESGLSQLDLSGNDLQDRGLRKLCVGLGRTTCKLDKLSLRGCGLGSMCVPFLTNALRSNPMQLAELHLMGNNIEDAEVRVLAELQQNKKYRLSTLDIPMD